MLYDLFESKTVLISKDEAVRATISFSVSVECRVLIAVNCTISYRISVDVVSLNIIGNCIGGIQRWQKLGEVMARIRRVLALVIDNIATVDQATTFAALVHLLDLTAVEAR